ncbi:PilL N-terminal domain-containing protein [Pseudomonas sp. MWU16-30317]|uniref:PFGI-1 class ICE element type IV pilus protein PilL2 n=1 Tax=Pseudomonas sp. MWU16-30317 TaxID=2878095 RepID=UPI001CF9A657|nr:PilL N-terminal domain-containing protein [Pseudomonas sp. MWU16-30317]
MNLNLPISLALALALTGCATARTDATPVPKTAAPVGSSATKPSLKSKSAPDIAQGRYGLVSTQPTVEQRDPLLQIIDVHITPTLNATVVDALHFVLQRSGYSLCAATPGVQTLFSRPLPSVHYQLGPISMMDALDVLGGEAWQLQTNPVLRTVCFTQRQVVINDPSLPAEGQP